MKYLKLFEEYEKENQILPDFYYVKVDETEQWREDLQKKAGKIYGIYLIDKNRIVHAASLQGSYEAHFIENFIKNSDNFEEEELTELEKMTNSDENIRYFNEGMTFEEEKSANDIVDKEELIEASNSEEEYNEIIEKLIEYYRGNPFW